MASDAAERLFKVEIIAADGSSFEFYTSHMQILCQSGWRGIMKNNGPVFALLDKGKMYYIDDEDEKNYIYVNEGTLAVIDRKTRILTQSFEVLA